MATPTHSEPTPSKPGDPRGSDAEYVRRVLAGNPDAFRPLVERYERPLRSYLAACGVAGADADDEVQETLVIAYRNLGRMRDADAFRAYLFQTARNRARTRWRDRARAPRRAEGAGAEPEAAGPGPVEAASGAEETDALRKAVASLPAPCSDVVALRYFGGLACREIADVAAMPLGTVLSHLDRARDRLAAALRETRP